MEPVVVRGVAIGEGVPKVCVPIVGSTREEIRRDAELCVKFSADLVEWRADWYEDILDFEKTKEVLKELRSILGEIPIIFTFRTMREGGEKQIEDQMYAQLNKVVAETGCVDLVDVEMFSGEDLIRNIMNEVRRFDVKIVGSNHDFEGTPSQNEIVTRLRMMDQLGADIVKISVTPQCKKDVVNLIAATEEAVTHFIKRPVVTVSMTRAGVISRITGEVFGSAITFGSAIKASAPGQVPVGELKKVLAMLHEIV